MTATPATATRKGAAVMRLALIGATLLLAGCLQQAEYGKSAPYLFHVQDKIPVRLPANAPAITQQFMPLTREGEPGHMGIDIAAAVGTPVFAAASGRVYLSYSEPMYGNRIILDHGKDSSGRRIFTVYKHLDARQVAAGATVRQGQQIGTLGQTGLLSSYPHLHFEVLRETAPGRRTAGGTNWWQGMAQEDPNLFWARGVGKPTCERRVRGGQGPLPIIYPVMCRG